MADLKWLALVAGFASARGDEGRAAVDLVERMKRSEFWMLAYTQFVTGASERSVGLLLKQAEIETRESTGGPLTPCAKGGTPVPPETAAPRGAGHER